MSLFQRLQELGKEKVSLLQFKGVHRVVLHCVCIVYNSRRRSRARRLPRQSHTHNLPYPRQHLLHPPRPILRWTRMSYVARPTQLSVNWQRTRISRFLIYTYIHARLGNSSLQFSVLRGMWRLILETVTIIILKLGSIV